MSRFQCPYCKSILESPAEHVHQGDLALAQWYAEQWNTLLESDGKVTQAMMDAADQELEDSDCRVNFDEDTGMWSVECGEVKYPGSEDVPKKCPKVHAPVGGVTVNGMFFRGGKFLPADVLTGMSWDQRQQVFDHQRRGQRDMRHMDESRLHWLADRYKRPSSQGAKEKKAELTARYQALHKKYGEDTHKRLVELAREFHDQMSTVAGSGREAIGYQLGQVLGMLSMAKGEQIPEQPLEGGKRDMTKESELPKGYGTP